VARGKLVSATEPNISSQASHLLSDEMPLKESYLLPAAADFHVHLRDNDISKVVIPMISNGGVDTVYVMPNLVPPITTVAMALEYRSVRQYRQS
jgi:dihydroorotase-like cyclic amidohydrolase